jgi:hypothetical protein
VQVITALVGSTLVVVPVELERGAAVFTVKMPARRLNRTRMKVIRRPRAELHIDLLLPSSPAVRQVQLNLPDGLTAEISPAGEPKVRAELVTGLPQPFEHLSALLSQLRDATEGTPLPVLASLAELAVVKVDAAREAMGHYRSEQVIDDRLLALRARLTDLGRAADPTELWAAGTASRAVWLARVLAAVRAAWPETGRPTRLRRRISVDAVSPRTVGVRAEAVESVPQRAAPRTARLSVWVTVTDSNLFDVARYAGWMSIVLMGVVLLLLTRIQEDPNVEVLAGVLTIFSAIQGGRVEHPDRSTLRGLLGSAGYGVIVSSVLPTIVLAVALAFILGSEPPSRGAHHAAVLVAVAALAVQGVVQLVMTRGPLSDVRVPDQPPRLELATAPAPDYLRTDVLQATWWRHTTAEALLLGREAHAYVVPQVTGNGSGRLQEILQVPAGLPRSPADFRAWLVRRPKDDEVEANILAMLRGSTGGRAFTFLVFRDEPKQEWAAGRGAQPVRLDPDRLSPVEPPAEVVDVLLGVAPAGRPVVIADHALTAVLAAAKQHHMVVFDVQLPVPPPVGQPADLRWMRVRVSVRDAQMIGIGAFLTELTEAARANRWRLRVQVSSVLSARDYVHGPRGPGGRTSLEVVRPGEDAGWRALAVCTYARRGIEADVLDWLGRHRPRLRLAALYCALLHGTSVMFLLADEPAGDTGGLDGLVEAYRADRLQVVEDRTYTADELLAGAPTPGGLLRVEVRALDRPRLVSDILASLGDVLGIGGPLAVRYARLQMADGQQASTLLTVQLPAKLEAVQRWTDGELETVERTIGRRLAVLALEQASASGRLPPVEDVVVNITAPPE